MSQSTLNIPAHVAMIMDGNGRWAERRGMPRLVGHRAGAETVRRIVEGCAERGIAVLSLYAFSADNWKRPGGEVAGLMRLFEGHLRSEGRRLAEEGIRLQIIGRRDRLPSRLLKAILAAESLTASGGRMTLRIAIDYSSRQEIESWSTAAPPQLSLGPDSRSALVWGPSVASARLDVDLMVRTGGERRLSDFLLWESAYAELAFLDVLWPDLSLADLDAVLADFAGRERRFGGLPGRATA